MAQARLRLALLTELQELESVSEEIEQWNAAGLPAPPELVQRQKHLQEQAEEVRRV